MHEIMTIEEVASYLRVSERTIYDWAQKGEIPGGKLGTAWRFKREDIEKWVDGRLSRSESKKAGVAVTASHVLSPERVIILESATKEQVLTKLVDLLAETPFVQDREELLTGIFNREELMSTGIGFGIGVPHVRIDSVAFQSGPGLPAIGDQLTAGHHFSDHEPGTVSPSQAAKRQVADSRHRGQNRPIADLDGSYIKSVLDHRALH